MHMLRDQARRYYDSKLAEHGPSAKGVDWNSEASQELRFAALLRLLEGEADASVLDYGCGYGALAVYLRRHGYIGPYAGFDVSERMVAVAHEGSAVERCTFSSHRSELTAM